jgi:hypothetical protein
MGLKWDQSFVTANSTNAELASDDIRNATLAVVILCVALAVTHTSTRALANRLSKAEVGNEVKK